MGETGQVGNGLDDSGWPREGGRGGRRAEGWKQEADQAGFADDADQHAAGQHRQVLQQETGGHDQACGADEQGHEEVAYAGELVQAVLLLVGGGQHHSCHKVPQL